MCEEREMEWRVCVSVKRERDGGCVSVKREGVCVNFVCDT